MATIRKQYYGIKFPFTTNNENEFFFDLNTTLTDKVASEIAHVVLTPKRTRIRKPDFGTDLIKFIFENNGDTSWEGVQKEAKEAIKKYVQGVELVSISILQDSADEHKYGLALEYTVTKGNKIENNKLLLKL